MTLTKTTDPDSGAPDFGFWSVVGFSTDQAGIDPQQGHQPFPFGAIQWIGKGIIMLG